MPTTDSLIKEMERLIKRYTSLLAQCQETLDKLRKLERVEDES
jgi:hypothetical protein